MSARGNTPRQRRFPLLRFAAAVVISILLAAAGLFAFDTFEDFVIRDSRFRFPQPRAFGDHSPKLTIHGVKNATTQDVARVFERDYGKSIYLLPIAERRRNLLAIDWVKDATVARIWPDEVRVEIQERTPVAFIAVGAGEAPATALVDEEGVLLYPRQAGQFNHLHVLRGLENERNEARRRAAVQRMLAVEEALRSHSDKISEIDVADPANAKIIFQHDERALLLHLGNRRFKARLASFIEHYPMIREKLPYATEFDVRLEKRFTAPGSLDTTGGASARR